MLVEKHKDNMLINSDCLKVDLNQKVDLIITDPPYFILPKGKKSFKNSYNFDWDNFQDFNDFKTFTKEWFKKYFEILKDNSFMYIFWSQKYFKEGFEIFNPSRVIFYNYSNLVLGGNGDFAYDYEPIFVIKKGNPKLIKGKHTSILKFTKPQSNFKKDKLLHPTQKPLELIKHLIQISNIPESGIILDMFAGSGTTLKASKELGFEYIGIEKTQEYIEIIKNRLDD